jgi:hypothetical protein
MRSAYQPLCVCGLSFGTELGCFVMTTLFNHPPGVSCYKAF